MCGMDPWYLVLIVMLGLGLVLSGGVPAEPVPYVDLQIGVYVLACPDP
jgi:hypothetical protein